MTIKTFRLLVVFVTGLVVGLLPSVWLWSRHDIGREKRSREAIFISGYTACLNRDRSILAGLYDPRQPPARRAFRVLAFQADCARTNGIPTYDCKDLYSLANVVCGPLRSAPSNWKSDVAPGKRTDTRSP